MAGAGLFGYLCGRRGTTISRQFLYHQCKMIDGVPNVEGTYCRSAMRVFSDAGLSGPLQSWGTADAGLPEESAWPYDPTVISDNTAHTPPPRNRHKPLYHRSRWANTKGEVVRCAVRTGKLVSDIRAILYRSGTPVLIGLPLYESFNNPNSRRTGWITLPLPGEVMAGGHAMLVVGFDDTLGVFLVRNSWGAGWAIDNRYGYPGHAVIPYRYFEVHGNGGYSVRSASKISVTIEPASRLYKRTASGAEAGLLAASRTRGSRRRSRKGRKKKGGLFKRKVRR